MPNIRHTRRAQFRALTGPGRARFRAAIRNVSRHLEKGLELFASTVGVSVSPESFVESSASAEGAAASAAAAAQLAELCCGSVRDALELLAEALEDVDAPPGTDAALTTGAASVADGDPIDPQDPI